MALSRASPTEPMLGCTSAWASRRLKVTLVYCRDAVIDSPGCLHLAAPPDRHLQRGEHQVDGLGRVDGVAEEVPVPDVLDDRDVSGPAEGDDGGQCPSPARVLSRSLPCSRGVSGSRGGRWEWTAVRDEQPPMCSGKSRKGPEDDPQTVGCLDAGCDCHGSRGRGFPGGRVAELCWRLLRSGAVAGSGLFISGIRCQFSNQSRYPMVIVSQDDAQAAAALPGKSLVYFAGARIVNTQWNAECTLQSGVRERLASEGCVREPDGQQRACERLCRRYRQLGPTTAWVSNVSAFVASSGVDGVFIDDIVRDRGRSRARISQVSSQSARESAWSRL